MHEMPAGDRLVQHVCTYIRITIGKVVGWEELAKNGCLRYAVYRTAGVFEIFSVYRWTYVIEERSKVHSRYLSINFRALLYV